MNKSRSVDDLRCEFGVPNHEPDSAIIIKKDMFLFVRRNCFSLNLCGYVILPEEHLLYKDTFDDYDVHGGITFDKRLKLEEFGLYLSMDKQRLDTARILGFDCAHLGDKVYSPVGFHDDPWGNSYRDIDYVFSELETLAQQIRDRAVHIARDLGVAVGIAIEDETLETQEEM